MRRFMKRWMVLSILTVGCLLNFAACSDDDGEKETAKAEFKLDSGTVNLSTAEAVSSAITYTLRNAGANSSFNVTSDQTWVKNFKTNVANKISFDVEANEESMAREAKVTVVYSDDANGDIKTSFVVKQVALDLAFTITPGEIGSSWIQLGMTPKDEDMKYMLAAVPVDDMDGYASDEAYFDYEMSNIQKYADEIGIDVKTLLSLFLSQGTLEDGTITLLEPETDYYLCCYGVTDDGELATTIVKKKVTTPAATAVDNNIDVTVVEAKARSVVMNVTTTTSDSYVLLYAPSADLAKMTDAQLKKELSTGDYSLLAGDKEETAFEDLTPDTDYTILAMGRAGKVATTDIMKITFKTKEAKLADITYSLPDKKYFDALEVQKLYPSIFGTGKVTADDAIIASNITADGAKALYTLVTTKASLEQLGVELTDEVYISLAKNYGTSYINIMTVVPYNTPIVVAGVAFDADENPSKVYTEEMTITKDNISPAADFAAYLSKQKALKSVLPNSKVSSMKSFLLKNQEKDASGFKSLSVKYLPGRLKK